MLTVDFTNKNQVLSHILIKVAEQEPIKITLHIGREGSFKLTSKLSHFRSK